MDAEARSRSRRRALAQWLGIAAAAAFVVWILSSRSDELSQAFALTPRLFWLITASVLATMVLNGIELQLIGGVFGARIPFDDGFMLALVPYAFNYLPLKTGTVLNGVLMKLRHGVRFADFVALVWGTSIVHIWVALVATGSALASLGEPFAGWVAFVAVPSLIVIGVLTWSRRARRGRLEDHRSLLLRSLGRAFDGIGAIFADGRLLLADLAINVGLILLSAGRILWSFETFSMEVTFAQALVVSSVMIVVARASLIPGNVGFKEGGSAVGSVMVGLEGTLGVAASVVERAVTLVWSVVLGVPAALYMARRAGIHVRDIADLRESLQGDPEA